MERLTKRNEMGVAVLRIPDNCENCNETIWTLHDIGNGNPIERLAHYEDLAEQGRLVELPCKLGDTIYDIYAVVKNGCGKIIPETVITIAIAEDRKGTFFYINRIRMDYSDFGKYVFFSSEEAEQALAERKE